MASGAARTLTYPLANRDSVSMSRIIILRPKQRAGPRSGDRLVQQAVRDDVIAVRRGNDRTERFF